MLGTCILFVNDSCVFIIGVSEGTVALYLCEVTTVVIVEFFFLLVGVEACGSGTIGIIL